MDMDSNVTKQAYIQILIDTLEKKKSILNKLMSVTEQQEEVLTAAKFDDSLFNRTISMKSEHLDTLNMLDEGFEKIYAGVKNEIISNKDHFKEEINTMKNLISDITDYSVKLQALEKRNKSKMEFLLTQKRKEIRNSRISSKTVSNYYKTMASQHESQSLFYDKKK